MIDGSTSPHLVPDTVAVLLFLRAVAEPPNASASALKRMYTKLAATGLAKDDIERIIPLLNSFWEKADSTDRQIARIYSESGGHALAASSRDKIESLRAEFQNETMQTYSQLLANVSSAERLKSHIQTIKRKMKAYSLPSMQGDDYHQH